MMRKPIGASTVKYRLRHWNSGRASCTKPPPATATQHFDNESERTNSTQRSSSSWNGPCKVRSASVSLSYMVTCCTISKTEEEDEPPVSATTVCSLVSIALVLVPVSECSYAESPKSLSQVLTGSAVGSFHRLCGCSRSVKCMLQSTQSTSTMLRTMGLPHHGQCVNSLGSK